MFRNFALIFFMIVSAVSVLKIRVRTQLLKEGDMQIRVVMHVGDPQTIKHLVKTTKSFSSGGSQALIASQIIDADAPSLATVARDK